MWTEVKRIVRKTPILGSFLMGARKSSFLNSTEYWEQRYRTGGNSGNGSRNRLAEFKATFLNDFVVREQVQSVLEFGCGDGYQLKLSTYPHYIGVDVSPCAIAQCSAAFQGDECKCFYLMGDLPSDVRADLSLSLDVIYHLLEDDVYERYMRELFARAQRFVIVYSSNTNRHSDAKHVRHRIFTDWVERNIPDWRLISTTPNPFPFDPANPDQTSFADFYVFGRIS